MQLPRPLLQGGPLWAVRPHAPLPERSADLLGLGLRGLLIAKGRLRCERRRRRREGGGGVAKGELLGERGALAA